MTEPRTAEAAVRSRRPAARIAASLTAAVKAKPATPSCASSWRSCCACSASGSARTRSSTSSPTLDAGTGPMRETVGHALRCELMRAQVFAGKRTPMVFGQPDEWLALLIESLLQAGQGERPCRTTSRQRAFDAAPAVAGLIDGQPFEWIADADSRLGPVLEACVNGRYYWVPFSRLSRVAFDAPVDLRDLRLDAGRSCASPTAARRWRWCRRAIPARRPARTVRSAGRARPNGRPLGAERWFGLGQRVLVDRRRRARHHVGALTIELDDRRARRSRACRRGARAATIQRGRADLAGPAPTVAARPADRRRAAAAQGGVEARVLTRAAVARRGAARPVVALQCDPPEPDAGSPRTRSVALWRQRRWRATRC